MDVTNNGKKLNQIHLFLNEANKETRSFKFVKKVRVTSFRERSDYTYDMTKILYFQSAYESIIEIRRILFYSNENTEHFSN